MGDEKKKQEASTENEQKQSPELSADELKQAVGGSVGTYLNIDGLKGESTDSTHKDWIEL